MLQNSAFRAPLAISLGAVAGALCRYYLGTWSIQRWGAAFPYGTLLINLSSCFVMGLFVTLSLRRVITVHPDVQLLVTTGFLGSYTTFATYELDAAKLIEKNWALDISYWLGSALLGVFSLKLGMVLAEFLYRKTDQNRSE